MTVNSRLPVAQPAMIRAVLDFMIRPANGLRGAGLLAVVGLAAGRLTVCRTGLMRFSQGRDSSSAPVCAGASVSNARSPLSVAAVSVFGTSCGAIRGLDSSEDSRGRVGDDKEASTEVSFDGDSTGFSAASDRGRESLVDTG